LERLIDILNKASNPVKWGGLAAAIVLLTAINFFVFVSDAADRIAQQQGEQRTLEQQLAEKKAIADNLTERRREMDSLDGKLQRPSPSCPRRKTSRSCSRS